MTTGKYLVDQMPVIKKIIEKAEGRIQETTGIKLQLGVTEVDELNVADNQMLHWVIKCCEVWQIPYSDILINNRKAVTVVRRKIIAHLIHTLFDRKVSQTRMANMIGLDDHSSFLYCVKSAKDLKHVADPLYMRYYLPVKHIFNEAETNQ